MLVQMLYVHPAPAASQLQLPDAVWRASETGPVASVACKTGWPALDAELPGGGWPGRSLTEILSPQASVIEFRLLGSALAQVTVGGGQVILVGPPKVPHLPGLVRAGLSRRQLVWVQAEAPAERLWVIEQIIKGNSAGAIVAWLPQARQEQVRRLQVCALACEAPVFLCRPESARNESSAALLRLHASVGLDWQLLVDVFKRRGPNSSRVLRLDSVPAGLEEVLTPRLQKPSQLLGVPELESVDATVGRSAPGIRALEQLPVH